jgi:CheY-like chemotaxis protein
MKALSVLVVDDASFIRDLIKRSIRGRFPKFKVEDAINGKKAIQLIKNGHFDLILCDWEMPEVSGIEVLTWLRKYEIETEKDKTPFIMITSRGDKNYVVEAVQSGVSEYIGKPFTGEKLIEKIIKVVSKQHPEFRGAKADTPKGMFKDSANALLGASGAASKPKKKVVSRAGSADLLSSNSVSSQLVDTKNDNRRKQPEKPKGSASLRTSASTFNGLIRDINLKEIVLLISRTDTLPSIFDTVVVDIVDPNDKQAVASMNACIISMVSADGTVSANSLTCKISWTDDDPEKMGVLSKIIEQIR